jgi:hypothetical protein
MTVLSELNLKAINLSPALPSKVQILHPPPAFLVELCFRGKSLLPVHEESEQEVIVLLHQPANTMAKDPSATYRYNENIWSL